MSRDYRIAILRPIDKRYREDCVYDIDEISMKDYYGNDRMQSIMPDYYCKLKVRSTYASSADIDAYVESKFKISLGDKLSRSYIYPRGGYRYYVDDRIYEIDGLEVEMLEKEHVDERRFINLYREYYPTIYVHGEIEKLFYDERVIDDALIQQVIELVDKSVDMDAAYEILNYLEDGLEYGAGRLIGSMILSKIAADRLGGIAVIAYD